MAENVALDCMTPVASLALTHDERYNNATDRQKHTSNSPHSASEYGILGLSNQHGVKRRLKARHISMIALGGTIGTGLFIGTSLALQQCGPVPMILGYVVTSMIVYAMMISLGEMACLFPITGSFTYYAARWLHPSAGVAVGYNYLLSYSLTCATEINAAAIIISFWDPNQRVDPAVWTTIFITLIICINLFGVRIYGEAEFWFSLLKVVTIVGLIILGIVLDLGGGPTHDRIGFRNIIKPGPEFMSIPGHWGVFLAFWYTLSQAAFSFIGTEIVALTAAEAEEPRRNIPRAIHRVFFRIAFFYIGGVFMIALLVPWNGIGINKESTATASSSPFVVAITNAKIKTLPSIVNAVLMMSAFSTANSDVYASSRTLYGLACANNAPELFSRCNDRGLPYWAIIASVSLAPLAYINKDNRITNSWRYLSQVSSTTGIIAWLVILVTYARFYRGLRFRNIKREEFQYKAPFQPYATYLAISILTLIIFTNGFTVFLKERWNVKEFVSSYITIPIFLLAFFYHKRRYTTSKGIYISIKEMDFETHRSFFDEDWQMNAIAREHPQPKNKSPWDRLEKILEWLL